MGLTVVDAGVIIGLLSESDAHHEGARRALSQAVERTDRLVVPGSAFAEVLVGPSRTGNEAVATVRRLLDRLPATVAPLDEDVAVVAAGLRARHRSLRLPDALVIATAEVLSARTLLTTDRRWPSATDLAITTAIQLV